MRKIKRMVYVIFVLTAGFLIANNSRGKSTNRSTLLGGSAKVNITPEKPMRMSGYANRTDPFSRVHDSLYASVLVFSDGKAKTALVTTDLIGLSSEFCKETAKLIEEQTGIAESDILLTAVHNHGGPVTRVYNSEGDENSVEYMQGVQKKIVGMVRKASQNLIPVKIGTKTGKCDMNINRRARFADGNVWLGRNPDGPCDHDVAVVRIDDMNNNPMAIFINWPCHGTVSGPKNMEITGDWPGATARFVEKAFGNQVIVLVTAGASANINPIYGPNDKFQDINAIGMLLGEEVMAVNKEIKTMAGGSVNCDIKTITAKGKKRLPERSPNQQLEPADNVGINLSVMKVGDIAFAGVSGELFTEIGMDIKKQSTIKNTIIITHCNGSSGYLCTDEAYPLGGYEVMVSHTMPGTETQIREGILGTIKNIQ